MPLSAGTRLGPYEILSSLGAGGMGEVYCARDTKLDRAVAIKILPKAFAADMERIARFQREAKTLASLNHPNIAHIHGLEESNGVRALVMELVEGEDLAQRIARGAIPVAEALPIAKQMADALEAAHEQGIIHRDVKPANIKVRPDGTVKVLDFGLAKAMEPTGAASPSVSQSPTITRPAMTQAGMILGTAAYMSPEQARGKPVDKRADIWAFGCVLYEMLTGWRTFRGEDVSMTLSNVLQREPDWTALPADTPAAVHRLLRRCLTKDRAGRLADIADAKIELHEASAEPATIANVVANRKRGVRWTTAVTVLLSATAAITATVLVQRVRSPQQGPQQRSVTRLEFNLPTGVELKTGSSQSVAISSDGTRVAVAAMRGGNRQIFIRRLDQVDQDEATPLRGTENALTCFFSPDGRALGFTVVGSELKTISLADGLVVPLANDVDFGGGIAWGSDDRITFVRAGTLWQIPSRGGNETQVTRLDAGKGEVAHRWPTAVAGGGVLLFTVFTGSSRGARHIEAVSLATGQRQVVVDTGALSFYAPSGHLIFSRDGALLATSFDVDRLVPTGSAVRVFEDLALDTEGAPVVALSQSGTLVYPSTRQATNKLVWVSRQGVEQPIPEAPRSYLHPSLAPDGQSVVVTTGGDLWIKDLTRLTFARLTTDATAGNSFPAWTPSRRVVFGTYTGLYSIETDGSRRFEAIPGTSANDYPTSVSSNGTLAFIRFAPHTSADIYVLSLSGNPKPHAIVNTSAYEGGAQFSPDGRWLAYTSDDTGEFQVYVRPFPGPDRRWPVSTQGGRQPRWNPNGKELFYRNGDKMMVVQVWTEPELRLSLPHLLFDQQYAFGISLTTPNYDVSPDGQRFVMVKDDSGPNRLNVVLNWQEELKQRVPTR